MSNSKKIIKFKKDSVIFTEGKEPKYTFYIIVSGTVAYYSYFADNYKVEYQAGDTIGLFNAVINEPFNSTVKAVEDVELLEMNVQEIENINDTNIINKMYNHLLLDLERWLNRYYYFLNKVYNPYAKEEKKTSNIIEIGTIYYNNGFYDAAYKVFNKYKESNPNNEGVEELLSKITPIEEPKAINNNVYRYKEGYCIYNELQSSDYLYIIKYGKVGIYNIFNSKIVTRKVSTDNDIINGYGSSKNRPYLTTAITLQDSIIQLIKKEEIMNLMYIDKNIRLYLIKIMSMRIYSTILRIKAFNADNIMGKFIIIIDALIKNELLFKDIKKIKFPYNINDICSIIGLDYNPYIESEIGKIKSVTIAENGNLTVKNIDDFYEEYKIYSQRILNK